VTPGIESVILMRCHAHLRDCFSFYTTCKLTCIHVYLFLQDVYAAAYVAAPAP
jgi:hypothetical protein